MTIAKDHYLSLEYFTYLKYGVRRAKRRKKNDKKGMGSLALYWEVYMHMDTKRSPINLLACVWGEKYQENKTLMHYSTSNSVVFDLT